jgi:hypothetical protein
VPRHRLKEARNKLNWTRDRVRRLNNITLLVELHARDLDALIHELGADDPGKEKLTAANEELHRALESLGAALGPAKTIWELTDGLKDFVVCRCCFRPIIQLENGYCAACLVAIKESGFL